MNRHKIIDKLKLVGMVLLLLAAPLSLVVLGGGGSSREQYDHIRR